jgi:hypothetical protein
MPSNLPIWAAQLRERWAANISSVFLLTGNTRDYVSGEYPMLVADFLEVLLKQDFGVVGFYNRATGLTITERDQENEFLRRAGSSASAPAGGAPASKLPQEPMRFFPAADRALRSRAAPEEGQAQSPVEKPTALVIEYAETLFPNSPALSPEERNALINIFGRMLRWLSEPSHRGRIVVLAATNRPDLLDAALKRAGRFDVKIPILPPDQDGRKDGLVKLLRRYSPSSSDCESAIGDIAPSTEGWTMAELELVIVKAVEIADDEDRETVIGRDLLDARGLVSPSTAETQYMTDLAVMECTDKSLLPLGYRAKLDDRTALEDSVREQEPRFRRARRTLTEEAA